MRKPSEKRLPHGVSTALVVSALLELSNRQGQAWVSRAQLMQALKLPASTVDDRLRVLVKRDQVERLFVDGKRSGKYRVVVPQPPAPPPEPDAPPVVAEPVTRPEPPPAPPPDPGQFDFDWWGSKRRR